MRISQIVLVAIVQLLSSCVQPVQFDLPLQSPQIVVNSLMVSDQPISVSVSQTMNPGDAMVSIPNANVRIWQGSNMLEKLVYGKDSWYLSTVLAVEGNIYRLEVELDGYPVVYAIDSMPTKTYIHKVTSELLSYDANDEPIFISKITFKDNSEIDNYYELLFYRLESNEAKKYVNIGGNIENPLSDLDPIILAEEDWQYNPSSLLFSDKLINGQTYSLRVGMGARYVELRSVSRAYYLFRKSWIRHEFNRGPSFTRFEIDYIYDTRLIGDPVEMYSNIEGGLGIFASYSVDEKETE